VGNWDRSHHCLTHKCLYTLHWHVPESWLQVVIGMSCRRSITTDFERISRNYEARNWRCFALAGLRYAAGKLNARQQFYADELLAYRRDTSLSAAESWSFWRCGQAFIRQVHGLYTTAGQEALTLIIYKTWRAALRRLFLQTVVTKMLHLQLHSLFMDGDFVRRRHMFRM